MENQYQNGQQQQQPPPPHHGSSRSMLGERRAARNEAFRQKLHQMALPLAPLVQLNTGAVHPAFPDTLLNFWLLTDAQLEELARFYHQRTPCRWTFHYPCPIRAWDARLPLEEKRRKIGRFIGLRGCESPVVVAAAAAAAAQAAAAASNHDVVMRSEEDEILEDARRARARADEEDEMWRRKLHWYS
ncbi:hypothetical protein SLS62_001273 [Diatrype stigma]|uniref:Uncharacterized protein n=1 Tax=Diatrype stigma TaxID=117547 RepID=A0AAN9YS17_9PEZI